MWYQLSWGGDDWWGHSGAENGVWTEVFFRESDKMGFVTLTNGDANDPNRQQRDPERDIESGLSLMLTRRLVEIHGGKFNIVRRNNLVGAHVQLPAPNMDVWQN